MYSTHNEGKSVIAERFIRFLKNKIYKQMTSMSIYIYIYIYIYIDKLDDRVNKYNNMYPSTIKMKPVGIESITYIDFNKENNKKIS